MDNVESCSLTDLVLDRFLKEYSKTSKSKNYSKPITVALYQTWKWFNKYEDQLGIFEDLTRVKHGCVNCDERHNMCGHEACKDGCPYFKIGKCFICEFRDDPHKCVAEDMSGYGCLNFKAKEKNNG